MFNKKNSITKIATLLLAYAPIVALGWDSVQWVGQPQLPKKLLKEDDQS